MLDMNIGDMTIEDAGDLGVNFNSRVNSPDHDPGDRITWVNEAGAEALRHWLNQRAADQAAACPAGSL